MNNAAVDIGVQLSSFGYTISPHLTLFLCSQKLQLQEKECTASPRITLFPITLMRKKNTKFCYRLFHLKVTASKNLLITLSEDLMY